MISFKSAPSSFPGGTPPSRRDGGQRESARAAEVLPPLPDLRAPDRAVLMLVHPGLLFVYWVKEEGPGRRLQESGRSARLCLDVSADGDQFEEDSRHELDLHATGRYLQNSCADCFVRVRLGTEAGTGFEELLRSNVLRVPRQAPGMEPEVWMDLAELRRSGVRRAGPRPTAARVDDARSRVGPAASSPGRRFGWSRPAPASALRNPGTGDTAAAGGYLCFVLHAHLPFVRHPEREYFLEETWLFEAITETYLPLLDVLERLLEAGVKARVTLSLTSTLMAMLRDPVLIGKYRRHLNRMCELARKEVERTRRDPDFAPTAGFYRDRLERFRTLYDGRYAGDLVAQFARLETEGVLEILACAATHGLLPHLAVTPASVRAQIATGVAEHRRQIGRPPRGIWLPECAYFEGLDSLLAEAGIDYFFVDSHAFRNASSPPRFDLHAPLFCPAGVAAFARDEECSVQVWSAELGYPGDPSYRDFYRDIGFDLDPTYVGPYLDPAGTRGMTGFKYHRVTGRTDRKEPYQRLEALRTVERHAGDFVSKRRLQLRRLGESMGRRPLVVAPYDAELFGHWWFEGPEWLEAVLRRLPGGGIRAVSPSEYLAGHPVAQVAEPSASSWGDGGYFEVWLNRDTDWIYPPLHDAGSRMAALASRIPQPGGLERRLLAQAGRELLLAQASDWPFILRNRTTVEYASRRIREHLDRFDRLARQLEEGARDEDYLSRVESQDNLFPEIDPGLWRSE